MGSNTSISKPSSSLMHFNAVNKIPLHVWVKICSYLYPSQLARLSQMNRAMYEMITSLGTWTEILKRAHPDRLDRVILGLPIPKSHMLYVLAMSFRICEQCFRYCRVVGHKNRACLPLPIPISLSPGQSGEHTPCTVRLCLACRRTHFKKHPEPIPSALQTRLRDAVDLTLKYGREAVRAATKVRGGKPTCLKESVVLGFARKQYGGDVALAARDQPVCDSLKKCAGRQYMYHSRMIIVATGTPWVDHMASELGETLSFAIGDLLLEDS
ncbi:hypothetical protein CPC16_007181 [Podila verticillata]|nr:hypothetical protein BGZ52_010994 [Haplosporangium bisporale]KAF9387180.1 hypothetical protein CPC16_007181 [Podila verticillata]KAI9235692.1 MAG: hypothetical protein BYD32DRAFT_463194 [Podila humilis]